MKIVVLALVKQPASQQTRQQHAGQVSRNVGQKKRNKPSRSTRFPRTRFLLPTPNCPPCYATTFQPGFCHDCVKFLPGTCQASSNQRSAFCSCPNVSVWKNPSLFYFETCQLSLTLALNAFAVENVHNLPCPQQVHTLCCATCRHICP